MTDKPDMPEQTTASGRYQTLGADRDMYLMRARECSLLTIPALVPPQGHSSSTPLYQPYQSIGSRGVNTLSSKLLMALMPPNAPFFKMIADPSVADKMSADPNFKTAVEAALAKYENVIQISIEGSADRVVFNEALKHLIVAGNVLVYAAVEGMKIFHLDKYVCKRDAMGNPLEMVVCEEIAYVSLPENIKTMVDREKTTDIQKVNVYTHIIRKPQQWYVYQEVCAMKVDGSDGQYPLDKCPWLPLRMIRVDGEDYGRSYVEEYIGDLKSLEGLSQAVVEGSKAAAKILFLVKPNGTTQIKALQGAPNLAIRSGNKDDVTVLQVDKYADFKVAKEMMDDLQQRLAYAFLMQSAIQRNAERVTAEEIRYMAGELDQALGGIYGILSVEFQIAYLNRKIAVLNKQGKLPRLPKGLVRPSIITGIEALGRGNDRDKLVRYVTTLAEAFPQQVASIIDANNFAARLASADGIDPTGLVKTADQQQAEQQQSQAAAMIHNIAPEAVKQMGAMVQTSAQQQQQPTANGQNGQSNAG